MDNLVSIIMPSFNYEEIHYGNIESVLAQSYQNWKWTIVDYYSSDNTEERVETYLSDNRIHYLQNEKNEAAFYRHILLRETKGKWIVFLDTDDSWMPERLERHIIFMEQNEYQYFYTSYEKTNEEVTYPAYRLQGRKESQKL